MRRTIVFALAFVLSCTTVQNQKSAPGKPDDLHFHNLKVLPQNISQDDLIKTMRIFSRSLGTNCGHCHVQTNAGAAEGTRPEFDFPSDAKPEKNIARTMVRMVHDVNSNYVSQIKDRKQDVTCMTCHRGKVIPEVPVVSGEAQPQAH
ncbi:MAG TPA: c-type cytochrome [Thermoanaerobaculia bacterium]